MACIICKKQYVLSNESSYDSDEKPHVCVTCGKSFSLKVQLKKHMEAHGDGIPYVCYSCEKNSSSSYNLRLSEKGTFGCEKCEESFESKRLLLQHVSSQHSSVDCDECDEIFHNASELKSHSNMHKSPRGPSKKRRIEKSYQCKHCGKSFPQLQALNRHYLSHTKYECKHCLTKFSLQKDLEYHQENECSRKKNKDDAKHDKKYTCLICQKSFTRKTALEGHISMHINDKSESAEEDSDVDGDLLSEETVERPNQKPSPQPKEIGKTKEEGNEKVLPKDQCLPKLKLRRPYPCDNCKNSFASASQLEKHKLTHKKRKQESTLQSKKYRCRICRELLLSKEEYKKHKATHNPDDKPMKRIKTYLCEICLTNFEKKKLWKKHMKTHKSKSGSQDDESSCHDKSKTRLKAKKRKTFTCETCGKHFAGLTYLKKHELRQMCGTSPRKSRPVETLTCPFCHADFTGRKLYFMRHKLTHTPEVCGICDERFVDRDGLREHLKTHIGTEEARKFLECSNKAQAIKNMKPEQPEPKVEYIYLVLR